MKTKTEQASEALQKEVVITRVFNASREVVFKAWTDPVHVAQWWGPHGYTNPVCEIDLCPGGAYHLVMRSEEGTEFPVRGSYREIQPPERLVFTCILENAEGGIILEILNTVTLDEAASGKTQVKLQASVTRATPEAAPNIAGLDEGWKQAFERLEKLVTEA